MSRRRSRAFWIALGLAVGIYAAALAATLVAVLATVPCHLALRLPDLGLCAFDVWPSMTTRWLVLALGMTAVAATSAAAARAGVTSWRRTRRIVRSIEAAERPPSEALSAAARAIPGVAVMQVDVRAPLALCYGVRRPAVAVSTGLVDTFSRDELAAVLHHEAAHVRRRDPLRLSVLRCVGALAPALPAVRGLVANAVVVIEWSADREAVARVGLRPVASALHRMLGGVPVDLGSVNAPAFCATAERVEHLASTAPPPTRIPRRAVAVSAVTAAVASYVATALLQLAGSASVTDVPVP